MATGSLRAFEFLHRRVIPRVLPPQRFTPLVAANVAGTEAFRHSLGRYELQEPEPKPGIFDVLPVKILVRIVSNVRAVQDLFSLERVCLSIYEGVFCKS